MKTKRQIPPSLEIIAQVMENARPRYAVDDDGKRSRVRRILGRGKFERRTLAQTTIKGVEYQFHATKGWRRRSV